MPNFAPDAGLTESPELGPQVLPSKQVFARELEALYRTHFNKVTGYFRRCGVEDAVAGELAQEAFVNALRGLENFNGQSKLSTWLWTIARNVMLGHFRSQFAPGISDGETDPDSLTNGDCAHQMDVRDCVRRGFSAFAAQHPERAQALYMVAVEGWSLSELAEFLGRTPHAATEYISQCRTKLKPFIAHCDEQN